MRHPVDALPGHVPSGRTPRTPVARTLGLSLILGIALGTPVAAQDDSRAGAQEPTAYSEIEGLLDSIRSRIDTMDRAAQDSSTAVEYLERQVVEAIDRLTSRQEENVALRQKVGGLSTEVESLAATRGALDAELARVIRARDGAIADLNAQVNLLAASLDDNRETLARLRTESDDLRARNRALLVELAEKDSALAEGESTLATLRTEYATLSHRTKALESELFDEAERAALVRNELDEREARLDALLLALTESDETLGRQRRVSAKAQAQIELLTRQLARLGRALEIAESEAEERKAVIAKLDRRLKLTLANKLEELQRYRSEFFGRLRKVLGERPGIRIEGDRFVFQSEVLFASGSAELGAEGQVQMARLAATLIELAREIPEDVDWILRVDGHTDKLPIHTARFPSNWELSTARAMSVVRYLAGRGVPPDRLAATGFGEFRPIDPRDDEIALRRNRRIELKLTQR